MNLNWNSFVTKATHISVCVCIYIYIRQDETVRVGMKGMRLTCFIGECP